MGYRPTLSAGAVLCGTAVLAALLGGPAVPAEAGKEPLKGRSARVETGKREEAPVHIQAKSMRERMAEVSPRFTKLADDPADVMPVGTSDLLAMLQYGDAYEMHLSKSDLFAFEKKPYHWNPTIHSPGHVQLSFGIPREAIQAFEQRLDLSRGSVVLELKTAEGTVKAEAFGIMGRNTLVIAVEDARPSARARAEFSIWRPGVTVTAAAGGTVSREVYDCDEKGKTVKDPSEVDPNDRLYKLGVSTAMAFADATRILAATGSTGGDSSNKTATLSVANPGSKYWLIITCATTYNGNPDAAAMGLMDAALKADKESLLKEHLAWWDKYWQASYVDLYGKDADYLMQLWYVGYYSYASAANGSVLPKFNGGPGLIHRDDRSWGWGYWWQNTRELIWPMFAANRLNYARDYLDFYDRGFMDGRTETAKKGKLGIRIGEAAFPYKPGTRAPAKAPSVFDRAAFDKAVANLGMENVRSGYNARSLAQSVELTQQMFDYVAFTGDKEFLRTIAAPWLKEATLFYLSYIRKGDDGLYHSMVSDVAEMWFKVKDPITDLSAIRYCFWMVNNYGAEFGYEPAFIETVRERLGKLAPIPTGLWQMGKGITDPAANLYAPAAAFYDDRGFHNMENPELYIVFPFALADANSSAPVYERAVNTFLKRHRVNSGGWSQDPVQAARLRLDNTVDVIMDHARKHQKYPFGGWNSPGQMMKTSKLGVTDAPYFDSMGVNLTALQEALLQSQNPTTPAKTDLLSGGPIVVLPAVRQDWAGRFKLRARGGFLVTAEFQPKRTPVKLTIESERGETLKLVNPFAACRVTMGGKLVQTSKAKTISITTKAGDVLQFTETRN